MIADFFSNNFETTDNGKNDSLTTHYYQNDKETCLEAVKEVAKELGLYLTNYDENYGEILLKQAKYELIVTLFNVHGRLTSVDIKINAFYGIPAGRPIKRMGSFYTALNSKLTLKRIGGGING